MVVGCSGSGGGGVLWLVVKDRMVCWVWGVGGVLVKVRKWEW